MSRRWLALAGALVPSSLHAQAPQYETTRVAEGVYQFRYATHNSLFVVTDDGVIAVDPLSTQAAAVLAGEIRQAAPGKPLKAIVYSHSDADHATGANVLRRAFGGYVPIIAQANARAPIVQAGDTALPPPDLTFGEELTLHYGDRPVRLVYLGKSHTDNLLVVLVPDVRLAFAVDFVGNDRVGYRDLPGYYFPDFFQALERFKALDYDRVVFGHGPPGDRAAIERQVRYYGDLRQAVEVAIRQGWSEDRAASEIKLPAYQSWGGYADWFPLNVRGMCRGLKGAAAR